ncbi:MAG: transglutaminase-like cysteine peptidase [Rhizobiaceae bacterium]
MRRDHIKSAAFAGVFALVGLSAIGSKTVSQNSVGSDIYPTTFVQTVFNSNAANWTLRLAGWDERSIEDQWIDEMTTGAVKSRRKTQGKKRRRSGLFGSVSIPFANIATADKWKRARQGVAARFNHNCGGSAECKTRKASVKRLLKRGTKLSFFQKLNEVNSAANRLIDYQPDVKTYRSRDHWALPSESLRRGLGDCEDYVILKMAMLKALNVPTKAMSLVVLKDTERNLYHAVLAISTNKGAFILDNVQKWVVMDKQLPHYLPLYSFSGSRSWVHGWKKSQKTRLAQASNLDFSNIMPGESFATVPVGVESISGSDLADLRPTVTQFPGDQLAFLSNSNRHDFRRFGMVGYPR